MFWSVLAVSRWIINSSRPWIVFVLGSKITTWQTPHSPVFALMSRWIGVPNETANKSASSPNLNMLINSYTMFSNVNDLKRVHRYANAWFTRRGRWVNKFSIRISNLYAKHFHSCDKWTYVCISVWWCVCITSSFMSGEEVTRPLHRKKETGFPTLHDS